MLPVGLLAEFIVTTRMLLAAGLAVVALCACAKRPESIAPAYVSHLQYESLSCRQIAEERARVDAAYVQAAQAQNDAATGDAWGVFLIGMPTSTLSGSNIAAQVAHLKGQQEALHQASLRKNCVA
jgi:hypothetical protein